MSFQLSGKTGSILAVLKISAILPRYPNFESVFDVFAHCSVHTKMLINIKLRKMSIFGSKQAKH